MSNMNNIMMKLFTVIMLMMFSMGVRAEVKVLYGENGTEKFEGTGGSIKVEEKSKDGTEVTVYLTFIPQSGYTFDENTLEVYAVVSPDAASTRSPQISGEPLKLTEEKTDVPSAKRYSVDIDSKLALWVKSANFINGSKGGDEPTRTDYSGMYYIGTRNYNANATATNYYLCPTEDWVYYTSDETEVSTDGDTYPNPFLTTFKCRNGVYDATKAVWTIVKVASNPDYYTIQQTITGRYLMSNAKIKNTPSNNNRRMRVHLESLTGTPPDKAQFSIYSYSGNNLTYLVISPKTSYGWGNDGNKACNWLTVNGGNTDYLYGNGSNGGPTGYTATGGIVGVYTEDDINGQFYLESTLFSSPIITSNYNQEGDNFTVTIEDSNNLPAGYDILYTTNGDIPTIGGATTYTTTSANPSCAITISDNCTVKAVIARYGIILTEVATQFVGRPDAPTITPSNDCTNMIEMSAAEGTSIYYTLDGTTPDNNSTPYSEPFVMNEVATIKAIAYNGNIRSDITTHYYTSPYTVKPTITSNGATITITGTGTIYYTTDGSEPDTDSTPYTESFTLTGSSGQVITVKAVAKDGSKGLSCVVEKSVTMARYISKLDDLEEISSHPSDICILTADINASGLTASISGFTGTFDGGYYTISGLTKPLFDNLNGATVKNVVLDPGTNATISGNGAICNEADGTTKIYNCGVLSGTVNGSGNVGGLVGQINSGSSVRVINCYNFATVSGGSTMAGIVGKNEGTVGAVRIALCMMYGNMSGGTSPVYAGNHTSNNKNFTEYNYWLYSTTDVNGQKVPKTFEYSVYNDQLAIDREEYLTRFPFYRHILNTHRELAAYFLFDDYSESHVDEIGHWVLKRGENAPLYPVIEQWAENTKKITVDLKNNVPNTTDDRKGKLLATMGSNGYLTVNIYINGSKVASPQLPITDMNEDSYDYTWGKVVLPFANEFSGWTRDYSKVCTGWEITSITGGTVGTFEHYDVANRDCTAKDLYANSNYIFAQGGYYIVPYGVTSININAHFANAFYLSDASYDVGYDASFNNPTALGGSVPTTYHSQTVYTDLTTLVSDLATTNNPHDQAIVLVGNFHYFVKNNANQVLFNTNKAVTIMSVDEDNNQEPDYGWYMGDTYGRLNLPPIRFDFVPIIEYGMSSRVNSTSTYPGLGIWHTRGWFEQTETCVSFKSQCEITSNQFNAGDDGKGNNRWIINSGYFIQIVRSKNKVCDKLSYIQVGGNAYVKELYPGNHTDNSFENIAVPIIVTGGQVDECYMTGYKTGGKLKGDIYFWCAGGKIKKFLGAYLDEPVANGTEPGNMTASVDHALIGRFFGGGTSASARIKGNIDVTINNSQVDFYCGGPEFGDMYSGKTVTTHATNTIFGEFYGAGYGGTSITYNREAQDDGVVFTGTTATYNLAFTNYTNNQLVYNSSYGIGTCYKFEYIFHSSGSKGVSRFYTGYAKFSLATTGTVTNVLNNCKIRKLDASSTIINQATSGDYYGAGCQGKVNGTVTSTLTGCSVEGSAFGGGYKAANNEVDVYPNTPPDYSVYTKETGIFSEFGTVAPEVFTWDQGTDDNKNTVDGTTLYTGTDVTLTDLGNVTGAISITIDGGYVGGTSLGQTPAQPATATSEARPAGGSVYGGGNESKSLNNTTVTLKGDAVIYGDVFGGGNKATVTGNATVNIGQ